MSLSPPVTSGMTQLMGRSGWSAKSICAETPTRLLGRSCTDVSALGISLNDGRGKVRPTKPLRHSPPNETVRRAAA